MPGFGPPRTTYRLSRSVRIVLVLSQRHVNVFILPWLQTTTMVRLILWLIVGFFLTSSCSSFKSSKLSVVLWEGSKNSKPFDVSGWVYHSEFGVGNGNGKPALPTTIPKSSCEWFLWPTKIGTNSPFNQTTAFDPMSTENTILRADTLVRPYARYFRFIQYGLVNPICFLLSCLLHTPGVDTPSPSLICQGAHRRASYSSYWGAVEGVFVGTTTFCTRTPHPSESRSDWDQPGETLHKCSSASWAYQAPAWAS